MIKSKLSITIFFSVIAGFNTSNIKSANNISKKEIFMNEEGRITSNPQDKKSSKIFTRYIIGCSVLALVTECEDGSSQAYESHFSSDYSTYPHNKQEQQEKLARENTNAFSKCKGRVKSKKLVIMLPNRNEDKEEPLEKHTGFAEALGNAAKVTNPTVLLYPIHNFHTFHKIAVTLNSDGSHDTEITKYTNTPWHDSESKRITSYKV